MKIQLAYLPLAAMVLLASCKKEPEHQAVPERDDQVRLGVNLLADVPVKGIGPLDRWNPRQDVFVYGIAREGKKDASSPTNLDFAAPFFINNVRVDAVPLAGEDAEERHEVDVYRIAKEHYYYGEERRFEFFGYYVDDAVAPRDAEGYPVPVKTDDRIELPIVIDGSQDILAATTDKADDIAWSKKTNLLPTRLYSAYSARQGVIPNLVFNHQLSRFNIFVKRGDRYDATHDINLADSLTLTRIQVLSNTAATLVVANRETNDENCQTLGNGLDASTFTSEKWLYVRRGEDVHNLSIDDKIHPAQEWNDRSYVGTVMVLPGKSVYHFRLGLDQKGYTDYPRISPDGRELYDIETEFDVDFARLISKDQDPKYSNGDTSTSSGLDKVAVAGHQYDVNIVVYGLQEVRITVSLTPWQDGGSVLSDKDPNMGIEALNVIANDVNMYIGEEHITKVEPSLTIGDVPGVEYQYEIADKEIATVDRSGYVLGHSAGTTRLQITAFRYLTDTAGEWTLREDGTRILLGKGEKTISVTVNELPLVSPELRLKTSDGTVIPNGGTLEWNIADEKQGRVIELFEEHKGSGEISYTITRQSVQGIPGDVLTKTGNGVFYVVCDIPEGTTGNVPEAAAEITASVSESAEEGYAASGDYTIHVIITNYKVQP